jgi:hypothetical protein
MHPTLDIGSCISSRIAQLGDHHGTIMVAVTQAVHKAGLGLGCAMREDRDSNSKLQAVTEQTAQACLLSNQDIQDSTVSSSKHTS